MRADAKKQYAGYVLCLALIVCALCGCQVMQRTSDTTLQDGRTVSVPSFLLAHRQWSGMEIGKNSDIQIRMLPADCNGGFSVKAVTQQEADTLRLLGGALIASMFECDYVYPDKTAERTLAILPVLTQRKREELSGVLERYNNSRIDFGVYMRIRDDYINMVGYTNTMLAVSSDGYIALPFRVCCQVDDSGSGWALGNGVANYDQAFFEGYIFYVSENGMFYIDDWYGMPAGGIDDTTYYAAEG